MTPCCTFLRIHIILAFEWQLPDCSYSSSPQRSRPLYLLRHVAQCLEHCRCPINTSLMNTNDPPTNRWTDQWINHWFLSVHQPQELCWVLTTAHGGKVSLLSSNFQLDRKAKLLQMSQICAKLCHTDRTEIEIQRWENEHRLEYKASLKQGLLSSQRPHPQGPPIRLPPHPQLLPTQYTGSAPGQSTQSTHLLRPLHNYLFLNKEIYNYVLKIRIQPFMHTYLRLLSLGVVLGKGLMDSRLFQKFKCTMT